MIKMRLKKVTELERLNILTGDGGVRHLTISADIDMNTIMNTLQTVAGTSTVTYSMVTECWPSLHSSQHVVGA